MEKDMKADKAKVDTGKGEDGLPVVSIKKTLLGLIDDVDVHTAAAILDAYDSISEEARKSLESLYDDLGKVGREVTVDDLTKRLVDLRKTCGDDKRLKAFVDAAEKDVKTYAPMFIGKANLAKIEQMLAKE